MADALLLGVTPDEVLATKSAYFAARNKCVPFGGIDKAQHSRNLELKTHPYRKSQTDNDSTHSP